MPYYTIVILLLLVAIVFFHYIEGLFSATFSAIFAVMAAAVAVGYHELIVESLLGGRFANESHALVLMILFAATYLFLRLIFDSLIKGNVRFPVVVDKVGACVMGLIAGIFAVGVMTIAAQEFPFGPDIGGYARYSVADRTLASMHVSGFSADQILSNSEELVSDQVGGFDTSQKSHIFPDADDAVVGTVSWLSDGSLAGAQPLSDIHPDLLQELFGQRIGLEVGANHTALNLASVPHQVSVVGVYTVKSTSLNVLDQYDVKFRNKQLEEIGVIANLDKGNATPDKMLLVVRTQFSGDLADTGYLRFSPGSIRLDAPQNIGTIEPGDYYPVGTVDDGKLYVDKPDDYLYVNLTGGDHVVDLAFLVDRWTDASAKTVTAMPSNSFIEVKRLARVDLSGMTIGTTPPDTKLGIGVLHVASGASMAPQAPAPGQPAMPKPPAPPTPAPASPAPAPGQPANPPPGNPMAPHVLVPETGGQVLLVDDVAVSSDLPAHLATTAAEAAKKRGSAIAGGSADLQDGKARSLSLDGSEAATDADKGDTQITELNPPKGQVFVRITAKPFGSDNSWAWAAHANKLSVIDAGGTEYPAQGVWAVLSLGGADHILAQYSEGYNLDEITPVDGTVTSVVFYVPVPTGTSLKSVTLDGKQIKDLAGMDSH